MKIIEYTRLIDLEDAAKSFGIDLYKTTFSYSFRIYDENKLTKEIHLFKLK